MKTLVNEYLESVKENSPRRFFCGDRRKQRNLERIVACQSMTYATMQGVIVDHRVVEALVQVDDDVRSIILTLESKLGRKLSRDRIKALLTAFIRVRTARLATEKLMSDLKFYSVVAHKSQGTTWAKLIGSGKALH